jgi:hypothetical protein
MLADPLRSALAAVVFGAAVAVLAPVAAAAADHLDAPALAQDAGADIADVFAFLDPTDDTQVVLIATVHPYIVPGQMTNAVAFDETVKYRFEIYNDHVNRPSPVFDDAVKPAAKKAYAAKLKPNLLIDVAFSKREVGSAAQTGTGGPIPVNLRRPQLQSASLSFTGFEDPSGDPLTNKGHYPAVGAPLFTVTPTTLVPTAPAFVIHDILVAPGQTVSFFAGAVDDPFFFDLPAFTAYVDSIRNGGPPDAAGFARARDTFAGYNVLAIAFRIPVALVAGTNGPMLGVDFLTQRHRNEIRSTKGKKAVGTFVTVDRAGNPLINSVLVPFDRNDLYNAASTKADVSRVFFDDIAQTLSDLGIAVEPPEAVFDTFMSLAVEKGDLLQLDTSISNSGSPAGARYPNGRRLPDDTADIFLTWINHGMTLGDGVNNSGAATASFPFLGKPNQPLATGSGTDDATRN